MIFKPKKCFPNKNKTNSKKTLKLPSRKKRKKFNKKTKENTMIVGSIDRETIDITNKGNLESNIMIVEATITKEEDIMIKKDYITKKEIMKKIAQRLIIGNLKILKRNQEIKIKKKMAFMTTSIKKDKTEEEEEETTMTEITEIDRGIMKTIIIKILKIKF